MQSLPRLLGNGKHKHFIDYFAEINSIISALALFPQFIELLSGKSSAGISKLSFFLIALNSIVWLMYGIHRRAPPLIISSTLNGLASTGILLLALLH